MPESNGRTREQEAVLTRMRKLNERHRRAVATEETLRVQRVHMYREGRALAPPLTFDEIAEAFGLTAAAVQQTLNKADNPKPRGKPGRPRGSKAKARR